MKEYFAAATNAQIRKRFWRFVASTVFILAVVWVLAAVEAFTGFRLFRFRVADPAEQRIPAILLFYSAISVILLVLGALWYWREHSVLSRGIAVTADVVNCEAEGFWGAPVITIRYAVEGTEFENRLSAGDNEAKSLEIGSQIDIIVDAKNPKRCTIVS